MTPQGGWGGGALTITSAGPRRLWSPASDCLRLSREALASRVRVVLDRFHPTCAGHGQTRLPSLSIFVPQERTSAGLRELEPLLYP